MPLEVEAEAVQHLFRLVDVVRQLVLRVGRAYPVEQAARVQRSRSRHIAAGQR